MWRRPGTFSAAEVLDRGNGSGSSHIEVVCVLSVSQRAFEIVESLRFLRSRGRDNRPHEHERENAQSDSLHV